MGKRKWFSFHPSGVHMLRLILRLKAGDVLEGGAGPHGDAGGE